VRLVAENRDLEFRGMSEDLLDAGYASHAVSDDHKFLH